MLGSNACARTHTHTYTNTNTHTHTHTHTHTQTHTHTHTGEHESRALQLELQKASKIRPLTHDVTKNIIGALGYAITRIVVTDLIQNT